MLFPCFFVSRYGYTGQRLRNNARYSLEGDVLYPVGSMVVVYNKVRHAQKYYTGHRGEVLSIAIHPEGRIVASGTYYFVYHLSYHLT